MALFDTNPLAQWWGAALNVPENHQKVVEKGMQRKPISWQEHQRRKAAANVRGMADAFGNQPYAATSPPAPPRVPAGTGKGLSPAELAVEPPPALTPKQQQAANYDGLKGAFRRQFGTEGVPGARAKTASISDAPKSPMEPALDSAQETQSSPKRTPDTASNTPSGRAFGPYASIIEREAARAGVPAHLLSGLLSQESGFDPKAVGDNGASVGMGQFNVNGALADFGLTREQVLSMEPEEQIRLAADFYRQKIDREGGDPLKGLVAYNGGGDPNYLDNVLGRLPGDRDQPMVASGSPMANEMGVDPRMASTDATGGPAVAPQTLPDKGAQGSPRGPQGQPSGLPPMPNFEPGFWDRYDHAGIFALFGGGKRGAEREILQDRIEAAKALKELNANPNAMTQYQKEVMDWRRDRLDHMKRMDEEEMYSATPAGRTGTGGAGGTAYPGGVTEANERRTLDNQAMAAASEAAEMRDTVNRGLETGAIGPGAMEGRGVGKAVDWFMSAMPFGNEKAIQDRDLRTTLRAQTVDKVMDVLQRFTGVTTDFEFKVSEETVPDAGSGKQAWDDFFDLMESEAARGLVASGRFDDEEDARAFTRQRFFAKRQGLDPSNKMDAYMEGTPEDRMNQYMP